MINGSQTLHTLKGAKKRDPNAQVLTRVLVAPFGDEVSRTSKKFVNDVIFRMNQQNPMKAYNLRANDPVQVSIASGFARYKVFYERREAEWKSLRRTHGNQGYRRLRSRDLAQILAACHPSYGPMAAKRKIEMLFEEPVYDDIFFGSSPKSVKSSNPLRVKSFAADSPPRPSGLGGRASPGSRPPGG